MSPEIISLRAFVLPIIQRLFEGKKRHFVDNSSCDHAVVENHGVITNANIFRSRCGPKPWCYWKMCSNHRAKRSDTKAAPTHQTSF